MAYIDPPFNTGQAFEQYDDALEHSVWLTMMRDRLVQIRDLLADDATLVVHLDATEVAYCKVMLDELFGRANFVGEIIAELNPKGRQLSRFFATSHDYLLVYARDIGKCSLRAATTENVAISDFPLVDDNGERHRLLPLRNTNKKFNLQTRPNLHYPLYGDPVTGAVTVERGVGSVAITPVFGDGTDAVWRWGRPLAEERASELRAKKVSGRLGVRWDIFQKDFHSESRTKKLQSIWPSSEIGSSDQARLEIAALFGAANAFATPKPERLMHRLIGLATDAGDVVLDCFAGSGTTLAVAHKTGRRWIGVERSTSICTTFIQPRLKAVSEGRDQRGAADLAGRDHGGGFRVLDVAASMFEVVNGRVVLADWATGGALAEAVAAQAGFTFEQDNPFSGRKGRQRLAVIDGLVNEDVLRLILPWLAEGELLTVYGTAVDPACKAVLSELRRGSSVKRIPQSVLDDYRRGGPPSDGLDWPSVVVPADPKDGPAEVGGTR